MEQVHRDKSRGCWMDLGQSRPGSRDTGAGVARMASSKGSPCYLKTDKEDHLVKRDMELIRKILLAAEADEVGRGLKPKIEGYEDGEIQRHIGLLQEHGMVRAIDASSGGREAY